MHCRYSFVPWLYSEEGVSVSSCLSGDLRVLLRCSEAVTFVEFCMEIERERVRVLCVSLNLNTFIAEFHQQMYFVIIW